MKEIKPGLREKIFALYWLQAVLKYTDCDDTYVNWLEHWRLAEKGKPYLELTPLSQITDEDAIEVAKALFPGNDRCTIIKSFSKGVGYIDVDSSTSTEYSLESHFDFNRLCDPYYGSNVCLNYAGGITQLSVIGMTDFLRSRGYALPAFGYSVKELVKAGIFKLKI